MNLFANYLGKTTTAVGMPSKQAAVAKVVIVGDSGVGKSTIFSSYFGERFNPCYVQTREREIKSDIVKVGQQSLELQIWDTPGNPLCRTITAAYIQDIQGVIVVYDVTADDTYYNVQHWLTAVNQYAGNGNAKFVFVGNKTDQRERKIFVESGEQLAKQYNGVYVDASAKTKENIDKIFQIMAEGILGEVAKQQSPPSLSESQERSDSPDRDNGGGGFRCTLL